MAEETKTKEIEKIEREEGYAEKEIEKKEKVDVWRYKKYICTVKPIKLYAGKRIIVLNHAEAQEHDIYLGYRTMVKYNGDSIAALVDTTEELVGPGEVGLFKDIMEELGLKGGEKIEIIHMDRPASVGYIKDKLDGKVLEGDQISMIIEDLMDNKLSEVELAAWVSAVYMHGLADSEIVPLTNAIVQSGERLELPSSVKNIVDKHCIGGVAGNRTTMLIVPIVAAAGLYIPKSSSRAITSAAGTADVMEILAPVDLGMEELKEAVMKTKGAIIWGGGLNLASADDKLIRIRNPLRLDPEGLLLSSILAKKKAVSARTVIIDIPIGRGAKLQDYEKGKTLASHFLKIGKDLDMRVEALITDGSEPIGNGVGAGLECRDVLQILEGAGPEDLRHKSCLLSGRILELSGKAEEGQGYAVADRIIRSGKALSKLKEIISVQGGNQDVLSTDIPVGKYTYDFVAERSGKISH
ncbi:thymidine phosphorylase, partial [Candidatus Micrarchaeota archaeon]|nr:thymidine phosphorylase [Candidatus Micrarchaeota archaeon]